MRTFGMEAATLVPSAGSRQAALLLHGIGKTDRRDVLAELSAPQRTELERLLGELERLGVPSSREIVDEVIAPAAPATPAAPELTAPSSSRSGIELAPLPARAIAGMLQDEADAVVVCALRLTDLGTRRKVLRRFAPARRRRLEQGLADRVDRPGGERLDQAVLEALVERAARIGTEAGAVTVAAGHPVVRWLSSCRRALDNGVRRFGEREPT